MTTVLLIEDHDLLATALEAAIGLRHDMTVVGVAATLEAGIEQARATRPDLVISDRHLPDGDLELSFERLISASPSSRVLVMTGWPTEHVLRAALECGAHGVVTKDQPLDELIDAARRVAAGQVSVPSWLLARLLGTERRAGTRAGCLTRREIEVLELLAAGRSTVEVAQQLHVSIHTMRNHLASAMAKLGVSTRMAAITEAVRLGLVVPPLPDTTAARATAGARSW
jgi:DNA-binding NarL/FixJ family response regulator